ncbi:MAG: hypothetical protein IPP07_30750 [Holophagales bacterium]|nr:hypothetical protein [Holophagales bacterium]
MSSWAPSLRRRGVQALDKVMGWDYRDELWFGRREATTIVIGIACPWP